MSGLSICQLRFSIRFFFLFAIPFAFAVRVVFDRKRDIVIIVGLLALVTAYQLITWGAGV